MIKRIVIILGAVVLLTACPETFPFEKIRIVNNSEENIFWLYRTEINGGEWYEISSIHSYFGGDIELEKNRILRGDTVYHRFNSPDHRSVLKMNVLRSA